MPLTLRLGTDDLTRCRFAVSPLCQTHEALRMLRRPARHAFHRDWLRWVRDVVAGLDLSELWLFIPRKGGYTPDFLGPPPRTPNAPFEEELARMRATDPAMAHAELARSLACTPGATESPYGRAALDDPAATVRRLADLTERAWQALLAPDWPRHQAVLEADIAHRTRQLADGGLEALFGDLHPGIDWADDTLTLRMYADHKEAQGADGRGILLMPSVFVRPDVVSGFARPWQPTVIYPARGPAGLPYAPAAEAPTALARLLGHHRAAILTGLHTPASTTALADRHGLAPSSVSAHLSVLREAGLLVSHRRGPYVLYGRTALGEALAAGA
ncbi:MULTISPECIES: DUF5937 family protein [unclassified Streptomyces]|uniref:ArsR/SmtB family transcription factor n=1 Tax=unclassified Streptomyces TaxID=2593676 RepID=UPI002E81942D|nr:DUF5937 family protein [Streptomyces sp. NBC_00589]WTI33917.1 winged helix-turn-helix domain-containing protein [Streptomyces sp. NBC_00775]WUB32410.1 winged helix-turn-helix domain-containing protein [Streptomyces sp. NBC_00589]